MVITIKDMDMILVDAIYKALENLGLGKTGFKSKAISKVICHMYLVKKRIYG